MKVLYLKDIITTIPAFAVTEGATAVLSLNTLCKVEHTTLDGLTATIEFVRRKEYIRRTMNVHSAVPVIYLN